MKKGPEAAPDRDPVLEPGALGRLRGDVGDDTFARLVSSFRQNLVLYRAELEGALAGGDAEATRRTAHNLAGLCAQFGAVEARELSRMLEQCARAPKDARAVMIDLGAAMDALDEALAGCG